MRKIATSKVSSRAQTVLPKDVRDALRVKPGDTVSFVIEADRITLERDTGAAEDPFHAFSEWASDADDHAFASL